MKRQAIKRACDDYEEDWPPYYEVGQHWDLGSNPVAKLKSVSQAAHKAMQWRPKPKVGF